MPIYQCTTPAGTVPDAVRPQIAKEITRLHVEVTNAPPSFVHVIILDVPPGVHYTAGEPTPTPPSSTALSAPDAPLRCART